MGVDVRWINTLYMHVLKYCWPQLIRSMNIKYLNTKILHIYIFTDMIHM